MAWTGKILGGALGSLLGPLGIFIGVGIGHQFDKASSNVRKAGQAIQLAFFGCLAKMARADGSVSKAEIDMVEQIMARFGYTGAMRDKAINIFRKAKDDSHTAADYLNQLAKIVQYNPQIAMTFIAALHAVAQADGSIHPNEHEILLQAERAFRLRPGTVDAMLNGSGSVADNLEQAYLVLEATSEMTDAEIKKIYRQKAMEFHPDRLTSQGLPDEFLEHAKDQLAKINNAYDVVKKARQM